MHMHAMTVMVLLNIPGAHECGTYPGGTVLDRSRSTISVKEIPFFTQFNISTRICVGTAGLKNFPLTFPSGNSKKAIIPYNNILCMQRQTLNQDKLKVNTFVPSGVNIFSRVS